MIDFNEEHIVWNIKDSHSELTINEGALRQILRNIFECDDNDINEYILNLEKDVKVSMLAESVEDLLKYVKYEGFHKDELNEYFYDFNEFVESLNSILECFFSDYKQISKIFDRVIVLNEKPHRYIIKQLMMVYGVLVGNKEYLSKKLLLDPLNKKNIKLKKVRNKNLNLDENYFMRKDFNYILNKQNEFTSFLESLSMNGTYEQICHKSLNMYYYNLFSKMVDLALFTERIAASTKYIRIFDGASEEVLKKKVIDKEIVKDICGHSMKFLEIEGVLTRDFILKKELESLYDEIVGEDEINFFNIVFEECKDSLKEELYNHYNLDIKDKFSCIKILDNLLIEDPYQDLFEKFLDGEIKSNSFEEYNPEIKETAINLLKKEIYYFLYKFIYEHERVNA